MQLYCTTSQVSCIGLEPNLLRPTPTDQRASTNGVLPQMVCFSTPLSHFTQWSTHRSTNVTWNGWRVKIKEFGTLCASDRRPTRPVSCRCGKRSGRGNFQGLGIESGSGAAN